MHPLGTGEVIDAGVLQWRRAVGPLTRRCLPAVLVSQGLAFAIAVLAAVNETQRYRGSDDTVGVRVVVYLVLGFVGVAWSAAAVARPVAADLLAVDVERIPRRPVGGTVAAVFLTVLLTLIGSVACVVPGIWLATACAFAGPAAVIEGGGGGAAIRRAWGLGHRRFGTALSVLVVGLVIHAALLMGVASPVQLIFDRFVDGENIVAAAVIQSITGLVAALLSVPWTACAIVTAYVEARVRLEGLDIAVHMQDLERNR